MQRTRRPSPGPAPNPGRRGPHALASLVVLTVALVIPAAPAVAQPPELRRAVDRLEPEIRRAMVGGSIPSLTVALVDRDGILWTGAYGQSNLWARTPATAETVYLIGSTFKAQSTVALLQQMEAGAFELDDPVHDYLDGEVVLRGEDPSRPVTFRHLLTHTSGLPAAYGGHPVWGETVPAPLDVYLSESLELEGPPMEDVVYSNLAFTLVAWLVERFSGVPYKRYVRERIWEPLGMETAFQPTPAMEERLSIPYAPDDDGRLRPAVRTKADVWPAGIVYGTVLDQGRWVAFNLGDGTAPDGTRLLREETLEAMQTLQFPGTSDGPMAGGWGYETPGYGLTWWTTTREGEAFFAHSGSVSGYTAFVMGNRTRGFGVAFLTNGNRAHPHLVRLSNLAVDLLTEDVGGGGGR